MQKAVDFYQIIKILMDNYQMNLATRDYIQIHPKKLNAISKDKIKCYY